MKLYKTYPYFRSNSSLSLHKADKQLHEIVRSFFHVNAKRAAAFLRVNVESKRYLSIPDAIIHSNGQTNNTDLVLYFVNQVIV